jgi:hypothetical protein
MDGVPNNAFALATFGGTNSTSKVGVALADALGMSTAEELYATAVTMWVPPHAPLGDPAFYNFAEWLMSVYQYFLISGTPPPNAVACAWYAVGVIDAVELLQTWNVNDCPCVGVQEGSYCGVQPPNGALSATSVFGQPKSLYTCSSGKLKAAGECAGNCVRKIDLGVEADYCDCQNLVEGSPCTANPTYPVGLTYCQFGFVPKKGKWHCNNGVAQCVATPGTDFCALGRPYLDSGKTLPNGDWCGYGGATGQFPNDCRVDTDCAGSTFCTINGGPCPPGVEIGNECLGQMPNSQYPDCFCRCTGTLQGPCSQYGGDACYDVSDRGRCTQ